jgi:lipid-A-disaccharide synthase
LEPRFFGAGGPRMAAAGVRLALDFTVHAVVGLTEVLKQVRKFRRIGKELLQFALRERPDVIVLVDYAGFNRRFAAAVQREVRSRQGPFQNWKPRIVYFVSPQVWASRPGRAYQLERDVDLLLSIFPFEKAWYAKRVPRLRVEFVGHPMIDRFSCGGRGGRGESAEGREGSVTPGSETGDGRRETGVRRPEPGMGRAGDARADILCPPEAPLVLLLPGSRAQEVRRHLPVMAGALTQIRGVLPKARFWMVLPNEDLAALAARCAEVQVVRDWTPQALRCSGGSGLLCSIGRLPELLACSDLAMASSGTVTMECAWFRVPTVVMYKVAWPTFWIARWIVHVPYVAMPNLLAGEALFPEFVQSDATAEKVGREALNLLLDTERRVRIRSGLERVMASLGGPGACGRAAEAVARLLR